ncbi:MAG: hypothetical protein HIU89_12775 [Proteobacteria bacterium]|nr:hypothetical protein [Pseudomonadota bacterium]
MLCVDSLPLPLPLPAIRQAFWLEARRADPRNGPEASTKHLWIWLEMRSGQLMAWSVFDLIEPTTEFLLAFSAALQSGASDWSALKDRLQGQWLFPPEYRAVALRAATLEPADELVREALDWVDVLEPMDEAMQAAVEETRRRLRGATREFLSRLDPHVLRQLRRLAHRPVTLGDYNHYIAWPQPQRLYRLQAIWSFDWIEPLLHGNPSAGGAEPSHELVHCIDLAQRLLPAIARSFGVRPAAIRRMRETPDVVNRCAERARAVAWLFDACLPGAPKFEDSADLADLVNGLAGLGWIDDRELVESVARTLDVARVRRLAEYLQEDEDDNAFGLVFSAYADYLGCGCRVEGIPVLRNLLVEGGVAKALDAIHCWFDETAPSEPDGRLASWPSLLNEPVQFGELLAIELLSGQALHEEGHAMEHCVADFWKDCVRGDWRVFSIRDIHGVRLSTIAFALTHDRIAGVEHRGKGNSSPGPPALEMEHCLLSAVEAALRHR